MANYQNILTEADLTVSELRTDHSSEKHSRLTILRYAGHRRKAAYYWCRCDCGTEKIVRWDCIRKGVTKSCGDCPKPHGNKSHAWKGVGEIGKDIWNSYYHSSVLKRFEFSVTMEYAWELFVHQDRRCAFTGWLLHFNKTYKDKSDRTASLDRIDSTKGYIEGNIQWIHRDVNKLKKNFSDEYFRDICDAISDKMHGRSNLLTFQPSAKQHIEKGKSYLSRR